MKQERSEEIKRVVYVKGGSITCALGRGGMVAWNPNRIQALGFGEIWYKCENTSPSYFVLST
jgi:hypothetical protein